MALLIKTRLLGVSDVCLTVFLSTLNLKEEHLLEITFHVTRERMCLQYSGEGRGNLKLGGEHITNLKFKSKTNLDRGGKGFIEHLL